MLLFIVIIHITKPLVHTKLETISGLETFVLKLKYLIIKYGNEFLFLM